MQYLSEDLQDIFGRGDLFAQVAALDGEVYRELEARRTFRFVAGGRAYFAKVHYGVGWAEIIKNLVQLRPPVLGAGNEWRALTRLAGLGIPTLKPVAYASEGWNPARRRSCIVTEALENTESLEDLCRRGKIDTALKRRLVRRLAVISRAMHDNGINHRDYYICHFLLDVTASVEAEPKLFLIDLHRAQIRAQTPGRWRVKDIGGLFFSAFDAGIDLKDLFRFMRWYSGKPLRRTLEEDGAFWRDVLARARQLYLQSNPVVPAWVDALANG